MRYKAKNIAALQIALGGLPDTMRVERLQAWSAQEARGMAEIGDNNSQEGDPESVVKGREQGER